MASGHVRYLLPSVLLAVLLCGDAGQAADPVGKSIAYFVKYLLSRTVHWEERIGRVTLGRCITLLGSLQPQAHSPRSPAAMVNQSKISNFRLIHQECRRVTQTTTTTTTGGQR